IGIMPRLVAGAHWGSDAFVGGVFLCLLALAWSCYTPLGQRASDWLEKLTLPLTSRLAGLPLLGRLSVISGRCGWRAETAPDSAPSEAQTRENRRRRAVCPRQISIPSLFNPTPP